MRNAFTFDVTTTSETTVSGSYAVWRASRKSPSEDVQVGEEHEFSASRRGSETRLSAILSPLNSIVEEVRSSR